MKDSHSWHLTLYQCKSQLIYEIILQNIYTMYYLLIHLLILISLYALLSAKSNL